MGGKFQAILVSSNRERERERERERDVFQWLALLSLCMQALLTAYEKSLQYIIPSFHSILHFH